MVLQSARTALGRGLAIALALGATVAPSAGAQPIDRTPPARGAPASMRLVNDIRSARARGAAVVPTWPARPRPIVRPRAVVSAPASKQSPERTPSLPEQLASARLATARYATDLQRAKADGYQIITRMIPDMGWHFMNANIQDFDVRRPPILVYERKGHAWQLAALEWVFPNKPTTPPLPGARYGSFPAACHYADGTFVSVPSQDRCPRTSPQTGATFGFWHPDLVTMHVWLWYPNPDGLFASENPLVRPFNEG